MIVAVPVLRPRKGWKSARQLRVATAYAKTQSRMSGIRLLISVKASSAAIVAQRSWVAVYGALQQLSVLQHHHNLGMHAARYLPRKLSLQKY